MAAPITVPPGFRAEFDYVVDRVGLDRAEAARLKDDVRADFAKFGTWVQDTARAWRFAEAVWGHLPSVDEAVAYMESYGAEANRAALERCGPIVMAQSCQRVSGVVA